MKTVKQILEHYSVYNDTQYGEKLKAVSDAGLLEENKLPILKRALQKEASQLTNAEKKVLNELVESLTEDNHLSKFDKRRPMGFPKGDKDVPVVLILKRKAIRIYPDNQKVALYYSDMLDKYFSVPFGPGTEHLGIHMSEAKKDDDDEEDYEKYLSGSEKERMAAIRRAKTREKAIQSIAKRTPEYKAATDPELSKAQRELNWQSDQPTAYKVGRAIGLNALRAGAWLTEPFRKGQPAKNSDKIKKDTTGSEKQPVVVPTGPEGAKTTKVAQRLKPEDMPSQVKAREIKAGLESGRLVKPVPKPGRPYPPVATGGPKEREGEELLDAARKVPPGTVLSRAAKEKLKAARRAASKTRKIPKGPR